MTNKWFAYWILIIMYWPIRMVYKSVFFDTVSGRLHTHKLSHATRFTIVKTNNVKREEKPRLERCHGNVINYNTYIYGIALTYSVRRYSS